MTTIAIAHWRGRVSPVFDVAERVMVAEVGAGVVGGRRDIRLAAEDPEGRASTLVRQGVGVLICGAISWPLQMAVTAAGIEVISQTCGDIEAVLSAYVGGRLSQSEFLMPGCCGRGRRFRRRRGRGGR